jgi:hypothetical protein
MCSVPKDVDFLHIMIEVVSSRVKKRGERIHEGGYLYCTKERELTSTAVWLHFQLAYHLSSSSLRVDCLLALLSLSMFVMRIRYQPNELYVQENGWGTNAEIDSND